MSHALEGFETMRERLFVQQLLSALAVLIQLGDHLPCNTIIICCRPRLFCESLQRMQHDALPAWTCHVTQLIRAVH